MIGAGSLGVHENNLDIFLKTVSLRLKHLNCSICKYVRYTDLFGYKVLFLCNQTGKWGSVGQHLVQKWKM